MTLQIIQSYVRFITHFGYGNTRNRKILRSYLMKRLYSWGRWCTAIISALGKFVFGSCKYKTSLGYIMRLCLEGKFFTFYSVI
jgi:hypothetical protein